MPALLGHTQPQQPVAWRHGEPISAARYLRDVARMAARLPAHGPVLNLCADRYRFAVGFGAALVRGHTSLLPPTHGDDMLAQLQSEHADLYLLSDQPARAIPLPQLRYTADEPIPMPAAALDYAPPDIDADFVAARVFTSGSTGRPTAHEKTWGKLVLNARAEHARLAAGMAPGFAIVGTVPAQHMYGFESTVLLALLNGAAFEASRPFYPADIARALLRVPAPRLLVTTPFHLRALLDADVESAPLALVLSATAPLAPQLAMRAESAFAAPLLEIYGCTEAGQLATRRPATSPLWKTFDHVQLRAEGGGFVASGGHVEGTVPLSDQLELHSPVEFALLGRSADMVNIAGKRTSLSALNHQLNSIAGVLDGAFYLPPAPADEGLAQRVQRPVAFAVAPTLTAAQLLHSLRSLIDPVFVPRPLHLVAQLPRNSTGKLPEHALADLASRLKSARLSMPTVPFTVDPAHPAFAGHFPGRPILPGVVLLDQVVRALEAADAAGPAAAPFIARYRLAVCKFHRPAGPGAQLAIHTEQQASGSIAFSVTESDQLIASGSFAPKA